MKKLRYTVDFLHYIYVFASFFFLSSLHYSVLLNLLDSCSCYVCHIYASLFYSLHRTWSLSSVLRCCLRNSSWFKCNISTKDI